MQSRVSAALLLLMVCTTRLPRVRISRSSATAVASTSYNTAACRRRWCATGSKGFWLRSAHNLAQRSDSLPVPSSTTVGMGGSDLSASQYICASVPLPPLHTMDIRRRGGSEEAPLPPPPLLPGTWLIAIRIDGTES
eukprot:9490731-Pyramimonas_sp.AAC.2